MLYYTDFIIYLWMVPVFSFLFLPLALTLVVLPLIRVRHFLLTHRIFTKEKRKHPRLSTSKDTIAQITVASTTCTALVSDISQTGICLKHLPEIFSYKINKMSVVIKKYGVDCNLLIKTKWTELTESGKKIGAEIDAASPEWGQFLLQAEKTH
ncbi:MAG: hypothetical protein K9K37_02605 [Desulfocapsa sp.]|nr:hypothetical protein [Desulfocapsa sp.]